MRSGRGRNHRASVVVAVVLLWSRAASADPLIISPSVGLAETFTDNVRFDTDDDADAITRLRLGLGFLYQTESSATTFNAGTSAFYRARSGDATFNLGEAQRVALATNYAYSDRLTFGISEGFGRVGSQVRDLAFVSGPFSSPTTNAPPVEEDPSGDNPSDVNLILPGGDALYNSLAISAAYQASPLWTTTAGVSNAVSNLADPGDTDVTQTIWLNLGRQYNEVLTFNGRLGYQYFYSNNARDSDSYSLAAGPAYQPASLWSVSALVGGSLNRTISTGHLRGAANVSLNVARSLENSVVTAGLHNGFTPSAGSGASRTFTVFTSYNRKLTQLLSGGLTTTYSRFDTNDNNFQVLGLQVGLFYPIWENVGAGLSYAYRWRDADQAEEDIFEAGTADANILSLSISWSSPLWLFDL